MNAPCALVIVDKVRFDKFARSSTRASGIMSPLASRTVPCHEAETACAAVATEGTDKMTIRRMKREWNLENLKGFERYRP